MNDVTEKLYLYHLVKKYWFDYMLFIRKESEATKGKICLNCGAELERENDYFCLRTGPEEDLCVYTWLLKNKDTLLEWITK